MYSWLKGPKLPFLRIEIQEDMPKCVQDLTTGWIFTGVYHANELILHKPGHVQLSTYGLASNST